MKERAIALPGAVNLRDFGGYTTTEGRRVQSRRLYRSGHMASLTDAGKQSFQELQVDTICDLRRPEERNHEPTPFPPHAPRRVEIPIDPGSAIEMRAELDRSDVPLEKRIAFMVEINRDLARHHKADYARMFEALLDVEQGGFLIHCAAGKDRTGFGCALILHALGVSEQVVLEDYLLTNQVMDFEGYILPRMRARFGEDAEFDHEAVMALAGVRPEYLRAAYETIAEEFDDVEYYLERAVGLDQRARATLQQRFLVSD